MGNLSKLLVLATALLGSAAVSHAAFSDDFSVTQASSTNNTSSGFDAGSTLLTSYGSRLLQTDVIANTDPGDARARTAISNGAFTFSSDDEVTAYAYDTYTFSTPINLTLTPDFAVALLSNDVSGTIGISLTDSSGAVSTASYTLFPLYAAFPSAITFTYAANITGVNTASISKLVFSFGGTKGEDLSIDSIQAVAAPTTPAVPEPGLLLTMPLMGTLAGVGLLVRRRRA